MPNRGLPLPHHTLGPLVALKAAGERAEWELLLRILHLWKQLRISKRFAEMAPYHGARDGETEAGGTHPCCQSDRGGCPLAPRPGTGVLKRLSPCPRPAVLSFRDGMRLPSETGKAQPREPAPVSPRREPVWAAAVRPLADPPALWVEGIPEHWQPAKNPGPQSAGEGRGQQLGSSWPASSAFRRVSRRTAGGRT